MSNTFFLDSLEPPNFNRKVNQTVSARIEQDYKILLINITNKAGLYKSANFNTNKRK